MLNFFFFLVVIDDIIVCKGSIVNFVIFLVPLKVKMLDIRHLWMESLGCSQWIQCLHSIYIDIDIDIYIYIIKCEFWQVYYWITFSFYILYAFKISRKSKINNYVINEMFKF